MNDIKCEVDVLDELNKGTCMGMDAINLIMDKVKDEQLCNVLKKEYKKYKDLSDKIHELYPDYSNKEPYEVGTMDKFMLWSGIEMKSIMDDSTSKLAEVLIEGTNMGIIKGRKLLNQSDNDSQVERLLDEYVKMQEKSLEELKKLL